MAVLTERQDKAIAINLAGMKVLMFDESKKQNDSYLSDAGCKVCVMSKPFGRHPARRCQCSLGRDKIKKGDGLFYLSQHGACLHAIDHYTDYVEFAEYANAPIIENGDRCAILVYNSVTGTSEVHTVIAQKVNADYSDAGEFVEEDMETSMKTINAIKRGW